MITGRKNTKTPVQLMENSSDGDKSMRVKTLLLSHSIPTSRADPNVYEINIGKLSFPFLGDQFDFVAVNTTAVSPIVFGYNNDISILGCKIYFIDDMPVPSKMGTQTIFYLVFI